MRAEDVAQSPSMYKGSGFNTQHQGAGEGPEQNFLLSDPGGSKCHPPVTKHSLTKHSFFFPLEKKVIMNICQARVLEIERTDEGE